MTEFAFSGVGINPHYGTPGNPYDRRLIPGGSSSGAAVSVGDGGPSSRSAATPAARCASRRRCAGSPASSRRRTASRATGRCRCRRRSIRSGRWPTASPAARSPTRFMAGEPPAAPAPVPAGRAAGVPQAMCSTGCARGGERLRGRLRGAVARRRPGRRPAARRIRRASGDQRRRRLRADRGLCLAPAADGAAATAYDPRVRGRIERASGMTAVDYIELARRARRPDRAGRAAHRRFRRAADADRGDHRAADRRLRASEDYRRLNALILRNSSAINFLDRCAITIPIQRRVRPSG